MKYLIMNMKSKYIYFLTSNSEFPGKIDYEIKGTFTHM